MDDEELLRYSRQLMLPMVDVAGQEKLARGRVLVIGAGGLGSPVAMYLAAAGVGTLTIVDDDAVELSNLQRQILHRTADIGLPKVESAKATLAALNPLVEVRALGRRLTGEALASAVAEADVVVDGSDNFPTRFELNDVCTRLVTPLVSGAAIRLEGQVTVFDPRRPDSPCYRCLYRDQPELEERCSETGVFTPLVGIIGSLQAAEAMKILLGIGEPLVGRLLLLDLRDSEWRCVRLPKDPACPCCGSGAGVASRQA